MSHFTSDHIFILPHAQEYQHFYDVQVSDVLSCLNSPDLREGLAEDRYTAEKTFNGHRVYVYYYLTLPLQGDKDEVYAIVDFVGYTAQEDIEKKN